MDESRALLAGLEQSSLEQTVLSLDRRSHISLVSVGFCVSLFTADILGGRKVLSIVIGDLLVDKQTLKCGRESGLPDLPWMEKQTRGICDYGGADRSLVCWARWGSQLWQLLWQ